jgi:arabinofuranosyltransferase
VLRLRRALSPSPRALRALGLGLAPALLAVLGAAYRWTSEDAFIDFRVVQHLLAGHGPVYAVGERVEAYTNPLWVAILALLAVPLRPFLGERVPLEWLAFALGLAGSAAGLLLAELGALRLARARGRVGRPLPLGALAVAALPPMWSFATSGLETGLALGWLGLCFWGSVRLPRAGRRWFPVVAGLGPLIRPDLAVYSAGFLAASLVITRGNARARARSVAAWAAAPLAYQIFRMGYFASVVPSTAIAKEASLARWDQGWIYLIDFVHPYHLEIPLAVAAILEIAAVRAAWAGRGRRRARLVAVVLAPVLSGLIHAAYVVRVGGDFMHARFLLPAWFAVLAPVAVVAGQRARRPLLPAAVTAVTAAWAIACALVLRVPYIGPGKDGIGPAGIADEHYYYAWYKGATPVTIGDYDHEPHGWAQEGWRLRQLAAERRVAIVPNDSTRSPDPRARTYEFEIAPGVPVDVVTARAHIGFLGYAAGLRVEPHDRLGLADAMAAHIVLERRGRPGHEKWLDLAWTLARFARWPVRYAGPTAPPVAKVVDARAALECGDLAELLAATHAPLTPARFARNLAVAWRLTWFRFPNDPTAARAALCLPGPGTPAPGAG